MDLKMFKNKGIVATLLLCWLFSYLAIYVYAKYAFGLFVWLPVVLGAVVTISGGYNMEVEKKELRNISFQALLIFCLGLLVFAFEGIICLVMAAPIGLLFTYIGHLIGFEIVKSKVKPVPPLVVVLLFLSVPGVMSFEYFEKDNSTLRHVTTAVEINASAETIWKNVVEFPELSPPGEFIFKTGVAYPINAKITGKGVGAVRHCNFSTGSFVEPITVWKEPSLLQFSVLNQPEPMKELSPYNIHPNHLHGYWISKKGQFKLTPLANGIFY